MGSELHFWLCLVDGLDAVCHSNINPFQVDFKWFVVCTSCPNLDCGLLNCLRTFSLVGMIFARCGFLWQQRLIKDILMSCSNTS